MQPRLNKLKENALLLIHETPFSAEVAEIPEADTSNFAINLKKFITAKDKKNGDRNMYRI